MTVNIDVELQGWRDDIAQMKSELKGLDDEEFELNAEVESAKEEIGELRSEVEFLTEGTHEIEVETNIDRDAIKRSLNEVSEELDDIDDFDLDLGDLGDLDDISVSIDADDFDAEVAEALEDFDPETKVTISTELEDDEDGLLGDLLDDDTDLERSGTIRWRSRGGYPSTSASGTINWDSDISYTDFQKELREAKAQAKASGATTIEWEIDEDSVEALDLDWGDIADLSGEDITIDVNTEGEHVDRLLRDLRDLDKESNYATVKTTRESKYREYVEQEYEPEDKEGTIWFDEKLRKEIWVRDKEGTIWYDEKRLNEVWVPDKEGRIEYEGDIDPEAENFLDKLHRTQSESTSRTHRYTEYTNYEARADWGSFEQAEEDVENLKRKVDADDELIDFRANLDTDEFERDLGQMLGDLDAMDTELEVEVCVTRCDDWKQNLQRIHKDLNTIKNWDDDEGDVDVTLSGTPREVSETVDRMEDSGMETDGSGSPWASANWNREDRKWISEQSAVVTETEGQQRRLQNVMDRRGISGDMSGDRFSMDDIEVTADELRAEVRRVYGDDIADSQAWHTKKNEVRETVKRKKYTEVVRGMERGGTHDWPGKDHPGDFTPFTREGETVSATDIIESDDNAIEMPEREVEDLFGGTRERSTEELHGRARQRWKQAKNEAAKQSAANRDMSGPHRWADLDNDRHPMANIMDREFAENPLDDTRTKKFWNRIFGDTEFEMPDSGFFDRDRKGGVGSVFTSAMHGGKMFSLEGTSNAISDFVDSEAFEEATESATSFRSQLRRLVPTMHKWYQLLALAIPLLITMATHALGAASAMAAMAAAGAAVTGLGLLGFGDDLNSSLEEAQSRLKDLAEDLFGAAQPLLKEFSMFTEQLLVTLPMKLQPLIESMSGLTVFMDNGMLDGLIGWMTEVTDAIVDFEPVIEQLGNRFGALLGQKIIDFFEWLLIEAYENQEMFIQLAAAVKDALLALYEASMVASKLLVVFSPLLDILRRVVGLFNNEWVVGVLAAIATMWGLYTVMLKVGLALKTLYTLGKVGIFMKLASSAAASIKPLITLAGWLAKVIGLKATALGMTIGGLALVATGLAAGYAAYKAVKPKGAPTSFSKGSVGGGGGATTGGFDGPGTSGGGGSFGNSGGGSTTVINVEGDITRDSLDDVEDAIERANERQNERNPD